MIRHACEICFSPPPHCPECGVAVLPRDRNEPFVVIKNEQHEQPYCRVHGGDVAPAYRAVLAEYEEKLRERRRAAIAGLDASTLADHADRAPLDATVRGWGGEDPDDLAAVLCAALAAAGAPARVRTLVNPASADGQRVVAFEVWSGEHRVATLPCHPFSVSEDESDEYALAIATLGGTIAQTMRPAHVNMRVTGRRGSDGEK